MYIYRFIILFFLFLSFVYCEDMLGININDTDIELSSSIEFNKPKKKKKYKSFFYTSEFNKPKKKKNTKKVFYTRYLADVNYINTKGKNLLSLGVTGNNNFYTSDVVSFGVGMKSIFAEKFLALPFYGKAMISVPHSNGSMLPTVSISTIVSYAPAILSMIDGKEYLEFRGEADVEIIPKIHIFTGYRKINLKYETFDRVFNDSIYGGMKFNF